MMLRRAYLATCVTVWLSGCVSAAPAFSGGRITPDKRAAMHLGAGTRIPFGELRPEQQSDAVDQRWLGFAKPGGVIPVAMARYGLSRTMDLEVTLAGASARSALRAALELEPGGFDHWPRVQLIGAVGAYGGIVQSDEGDLLNYGLDLPMVVGIDWASLYEFWAGVRGGMERYGGTLQSDPTSNSDFSGYAWRAGLVAGVALGFRNFHGLIELTAYYEHFSADVEQSDLAFSGISLVPAFALRWRI